MTEDEENNDNEDEIEKLINELKYEKSKRKKIIIILISSIIALLIIGGTIIIILKFFKKKENEPIIMEPAGYTNCLIFLHGLNDNAKHFQEYFEKINFTKKNKTKMIFLRAPIKNVTYKKMKNVTSWFDIYKLPMNSSDEYNFTEATESKNILNEYIKKEVKLLNGNYNKIFIGGHSQGACLALYEGYTADYILGGVISLCGILFPQIDKIENKEELKTFLGHGKKDKQIPFDFHKETIERISNYTGVEKYYNEQQTHFIDNYIELMLQLEGFLNRTII